MNVSGVYLAVYVMVCMVCVCGVYVCYISVSICVIICLNRGE